MMQSILRLAALISVVSMGQAVSSRHLQFVYGQCRLAGGVAGLGRAATGRSSVLMGV